MTCTFPMSPTYFVGRLVSRSEREITLSCSYRSTCFLWRWHQNMYMNRPRTNNWLLFSTIFKGFRTKWQCTVLLGFSLRSLPYSLILSFCWEQLCTYLSSRFCYAPMAFEALNCPMNAHSDWVISVKEGNWGSVPASRQTMLSWMCKIKLKINLTEAADFNLDSLTYLKLFPGGIFLEKQQGVQKKLSCKWFKKVYRTLEVMARVYLKIISHA